MEPPSEYLARAARAADFGALVDLKRLAGPGFTSLSGPDEALAARLDQSVRAFGGAPDGERYLLVLEHRASGRVVGVAQIKAHIGLAKPFFNYRILQQAQVSGAAGRRFDLDLLFLVNEFRGCTEVGSLFVRQEHRRAGAGRMLARARYMLMACAPERFGERVIAEMRGVVSADGQSPFWDCLGRAFFHMSFEEADALSAVTDNQFIVDLMPKYPVYIALLPREAREAIGKTHPDGEGALKLLKQEGFRFDGVIDVFDGGPVMSAPLGDIATVRNAHIVLIRSAVVGEHAKPGLIARPDIRDFAVIAAPLVEDGGQARMSAEALDALALREGERALVSAP